MTKVIVVGAGSIGRRHAENIETLGAHAELIGWRGLSLSGLKARLMSAQGLVVATATQIRLPLIELAAQANVPLYIEKPLAFTPDGLAAIMTAAAPVASRSIVGFMMRYHPAFRDLADADLSDTYRFDMSIGHDVTQWRQNWQFSQSYAAKPAGGGVLLDLCHELDMAACLFPGLRVGTVDSVGHASYPNVDMATRISLVAPGVSGSVSMDYLAPQLIRHSRICGTEATRDYDFAKQNYSVSTIDHINSPSHPLERNEMFLNAMRDFLALIKGSEPSAINHLPRLDLVGDSCALIARAWEKRRFIGNTTKDIS